MNRSTRSARSALSTIFLAGWEERFITLNLKMPKGRRIARDLCGTADVVINDFKPDGPEKQGILDLMPIV